MTRAQNENAPPLVLISHSTLPCCHQLHSKTRSERHGESCDNAHSRFAANVGRVLHARAVRKLAKVLEGHPDLFVAYSDNLITIPSPTAQGFTMSIATERGRCTVVFGQWEDDFALVDEAVGLIEDALHGDVRLRVDSDRLTSRWAMERRRPDGTWLELPRSCFHPDPRPRFQQTRTVYLHNDFRSLEPERHWPVDEAKAFPSIL